MAFLANTRKGLICVQKSQSRIYVVSKTGAALELAWEQLDAIVHGGAKTTLCDNYDWRTMRVWLHRSERVRAVALGHAMARASHDMPLEQWRMWLDMLAQ